MEKLTIVKLRLFYVICRTEDKSIRRILRKRIPEICSVGSKIIIDDQGEIMEDPECRKKRHQYLRDLIEESF